MTIQPGTLRFCNSLTAGLNRSQLSWNIGAGVLSGTDFWHLGAAGRRVHRLPGKAEEYRKGIW